MDSPNRNEDSPKHERLQLAMNLADRIRTQFADAEEARWYGVKEGLLVGGVCLAVSLRIRSSILRWAQGRYGHLPDLIITPFCAVGAAQAGLWVGTLTGARSHLDRVPRMNRTELNSFCTAAAVPARGLPRRRSFSANVVDEPSSRFSSSLWDPQEEALRSLERALRCCEEDANARGAVEQVSA